MTVPDWIWFIFIFAFGCCIGSFLNVVIFRLPRDKSLIRPGSFCPECGKHINFYDNVPLLSWLLLRAKCRYCKAPISPRYFIIESLTGLILVGLFIVYFRTDLRVGIAPFLRGGWFIYLIHIVMLSAFIAASAIDLEFWVIPLSICWLVTAVGFVGSAVGPYVVEYSLIRGYALLPSASSVSGTLAVGAAIGLVISWLLLVTGLLRRSYESDNVDNKDFKINSGDVNSEVKNTDQTMQYESSNSQFNHRLEISREIIFLLPIILCSLAAFWFVREVKFLRDLFVSLMQYPFIAGFLGGLWGYFVGCGVVWATRILGTLAFGKEAMGLGDAHLVGAAGAVIGPVAVVAAFFIAPFFGLAWAIFQMFFKKTRQIPYGPFLSLGVLVVIIIHDWIFRYWFLICNY